MFRDSLKWLELIFVSQPHSNVMAKYAVGKKSIISYFNVGNFILAPPAALCNGSYYSKVTGLVGFLVEATTGWVVLSPRLGS